MNNKSRVAIVRCHDYEQATVQKAVAEGFALLEPVDELLGRKKNVLLKPNLLHGDRPERGSTTHPAIFGGVAAYLQSRGFSLTYGDSPAFQSTKGAVASSGFKKIAEKHGVKLADFETGEEKSFPQGKQNRVFFLARGVLEAETIVNIPKLKTHALTRMTGAVKNMFGIIPGLKKSWFHARLSDEKSFSHMLIDLIRMIPPTLSVMDAVYGMEGNGPRNGNLVPTGLLLFSSDPVALDATACRIMGIKPEDVYFLSYAKSLGCGALAEEEIEIVGVTLAQAAGRPYTLHPPNQAVFSKSPLLKYVKSLIVPRPVIDDTMCSRCLQCVRICPVSPKALSAEKQTIPDFNYQRCIRCYCCQETCPEGAIKNRVPFLGTLFHGFSRRF